MEVFGTYSPNLNARFFSFLRPQDILAGKKFGENEEVFARIEISFETEFNCATKLVAKCKKIDKSGKISE